MLDEDIKGLYLKKPHTIMDTLVTFMQSANETEEVQGLNFQSFPN